MVDPARQNYALLKKGIVMQTGIIKKRYWIVLSVLVSFSNAKALTTTVEPISINDGIWRVLSRVGNALDTLSPCIFGIQQTDIPLTITSPGYYCFNQDLVFTTTGIIIATNNVTVDFNAHTLDGQNNGNGVGIQLTNGAQNIVIKNGAIQNIGGSLGAAIADVNNGLPLDNIVIQDMSFINLVFNSILLNRQAAGQDVNGLIVERCNGHNGGNILLCNGNNIVVRSSIFDNINPLNGGVACLVLGGSSSSGIGENALLEDVVITSTIFNLQGCRMFLTSWKNGELRNCRMDGGRVDCFVLLAITNLRVSDCVAGFSTGAGFQCSSSSNGSIIFERCVAQSMGLNGFLIQGTGGGALLIDCIAQHCSSSGFSSAGNNLVMRNCTASQCVGGISVGSASNNCVFENCMAQGCSGIGFSLGPCQDIVLRNCIAQQNTGVGFSLANISHCVIEGCIAQKNTGVGFSLASTCTDTEMIQCRALRNGGIGINNLASGNKNFIFGCTSLGNVGNDYSVFADPTKIVSYSQIGATANAKFWQNIKS